MSKIYLDNAATTAVDKRVLKAMLPYFSIKYGNPASKHSLGEEARNALEKSREIIAKSINAKPREIIFTSGGTESNNLALKGLFFANKNLGKIHIITTKIEHDSVLNCCKWLEKQGARITYLDVDKEGFVDLDELRKSITNNTLVVSIIHGNNEIGVLQDLQEIGRICREKGVYFHSDACQSYMKTNIDVKKMNVDLLTLNAHKIHGPKGVGALYVRDGVNIDPLLHGGEHEFGLRSGTVNTAGVVGFSEAVKIYTGLPEFKKMQKLRDKLIDELVKVKDVKLNGSRNKRLVNNINIYIKGIEGETLGEYLDNEGISISTGSACDSNIKETSHVLKAIGLNDRDVKQCVRISLSRFNTEKEIDEFLVKIKRLVEKLRVAT